MNDSSMVSAAKAAMLLGVNYSTLINWIGDGKIAAEKDEHAGKSSAYRIPLSEIDRIAQERNPGALVAAQTAILQRQLDDLTARVNHLEALIMGQIRGTSALPRAGPVAAKDSAIPTARPAAPATTAQDMPAGLVGWTSHIKEHWSSEKQPPYTSIQRHIPGLAGQWTVEGHAVTRALDDPGRRAFHLAYVRREDFQRVQGCPYCEELI